MKQPPSEPGVMSFYNSIADGKSQGADEDANSSKDAILMPILNKEYVNQLAGRKLSK